MENHIHQLLLKFEICCPGTSRFTETSELGQMFLSNWKCTWARVPMCPHYLKVWEIWSKTTSKVQWTVENRCKSISRKMHSAQLAKPHNSLITWWKKPAEPHSVIKKLWQTGRQIEYLCIINQINLYILMVLSAELMTLNNWINLYREQNLN